MSKNSDTGENWVLGITLGLLGSIAINTGNNIQSLGLKGLKDKAKSHGRAKTAPINDNDEFVDDADSTESNPCSSSVWIIGTCIFVSGSLINFASYAFAAQSMLASLESVQFVTNLLFGKFMLKANVTRRMMVGTMFTVLGTVIAVQFSSKTTLELTTSEMVELYRNPAYVTYLALMFLSMAILSYLYRKYKKSKQRRAPLPHTEIIMPLCYSIWSALCGTQSVVQAKILAELLTLQTSGTENVFRSKFLYVTLVLWFISAWIWLTRLNNSLSKFDPLFIIPLLQCSFIFFAIVSGGIFFKEFNGFSPNQWCGFWCGVLIMFFGLRLLTPLQGIANKEKSTRRISNGVVVKDASSCSSNNPRTPVSNNIGGKSYSAKRLPVYISTPPHKESFEIDIISSAESKKSCSSGVDTNWQSTPNESPRPSRKNRQSRQSLKGAALQALRDTIIDSSLVLLTSPNGPALMTKAMMEASEEKDKHEVARRKKLDKLSDLVNEHTDNPGNLLSKESFDLLNDLGIDTGINTGSDHDVEAMKHFISSPSDFREEICRQMNELKNEI